jgi:hypothetical protein
MKEESQVLRKPSFLVDKKCSMKEMKEKHLKINQEMDFLLGKFSMMFWRVLVIVQDEKLIVGPYQIPKK